MLIGDSRNLLNMRAEKASCHLTFRHWVDRRPAPPGENTAAYSSLEQAEMVRVHEPGVADKGGVSA